MTTTTAFTRTVGTVGVDPPWKRTYPYAAVTMTAIAPRTLPCGSRRGSGSWPTGGIATFAQRWMGRLRLTIRSQKSRRRRCRSPASTGAAGDRRPRIRTTRGSKGLCGLRRRAIPLRGPRIQPERTGRGPSSGFAATRPRSRCTVGCSSYRPPPDPRIHAAHGPSVADCGVRREGFVRRINWLRKSSVSLVPMHVWLITMEVNKAFVLIMETFIIEHKHTLLRRRPMKAFKVIKSPEAFQLLADETRRRIIYLLRAKEMTVSQIAAELNLTPQAIYHHIRKMSEADLVEVAREERVDHFIETYYRATAEMFNLSHGEGMSPAYAAEQATEASQALAKIGLRVRTDPEVVARIVELEKRMEAVGEKPEWAEAISGLEGVDFFVKQGITHLAKLLTMTDKEFTEYLNVEREYRKLLRSLLEEPAKVEERSQELAVFALDVQEFRE